MIKNYNIKLRRYALTILIDDIDYLRYIMKKLQKFNKYLKLQLIPNLYGGFINLFIEYNFYNKYKDNLIFKYLMDIRIDYEITYKYIKKR